MNFACANTETKEIMVAIVRCQLESSSKMPQRRDGATEKNNFSPNFFILAKMSLILFESLILATKSKCQTSSRLH